MKKSLFFCLLAVLLAPTAAKAVSAQAQEYDELGQALYRQGLYAKAIPYFQNAVQTDPTDWEGYQNLGNAYFKINANSDALTAYQKSLQINPDNDTLENIVQNLEKSATPVGNANIPNNAPAMNPSSSAPPASVDSEQPINQPPQAAAPPQQPQQPQQPGQTVIITRRHGWSTYAAQPDPVYTDGLAAIDHAKFFSKFQLGYTYASVPDLINGAANINNGSYVNQEQFGTGSTVGYSGSALATNSGANVGAEFGFMLNPYSGISLGVKYIGLGNYTANVSYNDSYDDYENATLSSYVIPITLNYYLFMPDSSGRFYIKGGVGYYYGGVHVNETYSYSNFYNQQEANNNENWVGDLNSGAVGFQIGIGREFQVSRHVGIEIYAEGRYAKITNFTGTLYDQYGNSTAAGLAMGNTNGTIDFDGPSTINAANGEHYATLDFTGFDIGVAFNWYSF